MKRMLLLALAAATLGRADTTILEYDVVYKERPVGTQTVRMESNDGGMTRLEATSSMEIPVFLARYRFEDRLNIRFDAKGIRGYQYHALDNGKPLDVRATSDPRGHLQVDRNQNGKEDHAVIYHDQYNLLSWAPYLDPALAWAPPAGTSRTAQVFSPEEVEVSAQRIEYGGVETVEAAHRTVDAARYDWIRGRYTSRTWHAKEFGNAPVKYLFQDENGDTLFLLRERKVLAGEEAGE